MNKEFKEGFSKGLGFASGLIAIPVAVIFLFVSYGIAQNLFKAVLQSKEKKEYLDCQSKSLDRLLEQDQAKRKGLPVPPFLEMCEKPTREWKWQQRKE